ncbi:hypothetical protein BJ138DRAFT_1106018 [Hygrophoropsis aurantiaca]|uniref:Uncharacterized protein n=1 Tax=Hygrophoropsis aurantiaca TaxID=72124 RepID=A0ACB7ZX02_9AGAM|nr:hypothetical protein BJ138DRAFT_1106018 [Hygrophoropsis aurantiaca]
MPKRKASTLRSIANFGHNTSKKARCDNKENVPTTSLISRAVVPPPEGQRVDSCQSEALQPFHSNFGGPGLASGVDQPLDLSTNEENHHCGCSTQEDSDLHVWDAYQKFIVLKPEDSASQKANLTGISGHSVNGMNPEASDLNVDLSLTFGASVTPEGSEDDAAGQVYEFIEESGLGEDAEGSESDSSESESESGEGEVEPTDCDDTESEAEGSGQAKIVRDYSYESRRAPSIKCAQEALRDINLTLKPPRNSGYGYKDARLPLVLRTKLEWLASFLWLYTDSGSRLAKGTVYSCWTAASLRAAHAQQRPPWHAQQRPPWHAHNLRKWARAYIIDREALPLSGNGKSRKSRIDDDHVATDIALHLQSVGKYVRSLDIIHYLEQPGVKLRLKIKKTPHLSTAKKWMTKMGYRWTKNPAGQYVDGHEREDVVWYRQTVFLPAWQMLEDRTRKWLADNTEVLEPSSPHRHIVVWFHDESTFYANDRRVVRWVFKGETAVPRTKGEGASLMVADFVSADYGWLRSPDGNKQGRVLFRCGKARDGYFTNLDIQNHTKNAMDILDEHFSNEDHVLVFDNATTHLKRADNALSARKMPKGIPKKGGNWGVEVVKVDIDGKSVFSADGKVCKIKVPMSDGRFDDGTIQPLYFPPNDPRGPEGTFKGMAVILEERKHKDPLKFTFADYTKLKAQCGKNFDCKKDQINCCCRRILYTQPDFTRVESLLETLCKARGYQNSAGALQSDYIDNSPPHLKKLISKKMFSHLSTRSL